MESMARAVEPPAGSPTQHAESLAVCGDIARLLQLGRPALLLALADLQRVLEAGRAELGGSNWRAAACASAAPVAKDLRRQLKAAAQKAHFLMAWVNEQPEELWQVLAVAVAAEQPRGVMKGQALERGMPSTPGMLLQPSSHLPAMEQHAPLAMQQPRIQPLPVQHQMQRCMQMDQQQEEIDLAALD